jgi:hypothetical protein
MESVFSRRRCDGENLSLRSYVPELEYVRGRGIAKRCGSLPLALPRWRRGVSSVPNPGTYTDWAFGACPAERSPAARHPRARPNRGVPPAVSGRTIASSRARPKSQACGWPGACGVRPPPGIYDQQPATRARARPNGGGVDGLGSRPESRRPGAGGAAARPGALRPGFGFSD